MGIKVREDEFSLCLENIFSYYDAFHSLSEDMDITLHTTCYILYCVEQTGFKANVKL
ncbi:MAG TPA: hypothetical protein VJ023_08125 [Pyrinomonadaceae bacterium]|nr:hypothetical protein [Pyrinomonadaceae bacterium]